MKKLKKENCNNNNLENLGIAQFCGDTISIPCDDEPCIPVIVDKLGKKLKSIEIPEKNEGNHDNSELIELLKRLLDLIRVRMGKS